jgi:hypothetical protein
MYREKLKGILGVDSFGAAQPFSTTEAKDVLHPDVILGFIDAFFEQHVRANRSHLRTTVSFCSSCVMTLRRDL